MEPVILVAAPCLFIMFFPEPVIALMLSAACGVRMCHVFFRQCRARAVKRVDLWSISGAAILLFIINCSCPDRLRLAMIYFALILTARFIISLIVHRENSPTYIFGEMMRLNRRLQSALEPITIERCDEISSERLSETSDLLREIDRRYNDRMQALTDRLEEVNARLRCRMHDLEVQRDEMQQKLFDLRESFDRARERLKRTDARSENRLGDEEVRRRFHEALSSAECELDIASCWMSFKVMRALKPRLRDLLERGVTIKIFYGACESDDARDVITRRVAKMLRKEFKRYPHFRMMQGHVRAKIFICDESFCVRTEYNILSFDGALHCEYSDDADLIRDCREKYF